MLFTKPKKAVGIDVGSHSVKSVQMSRSAGHLRIDAAGYALVDRGQFNIDPVAAQANAIRESVRSMAVQNALLVGALPGHTVVIRYPRLPQTDEARLTEAVEKEAGQHIPYDLAEVSLDWSLLDTVTEGEEKLSKVLLVAAKHEVIDARVQLADAADVRYSVLGVDSLALADAAEVCDFLRVGETVALVNIGLTSTSVHFVKDGVSNFIRDVSWGARELIQAISRQQKLDFDQAERALYAAADESGDAAPVEVPRAEEAKPAAKGSSPLDPFEDELDGGLSPAKKAAPSTGDKNTGEIIATTLTKLVNEIRRSFEYYEHELYETMVDRLILSGGIAHLPILNKTLTDELGLKSVEVADPSNSALFLGDDRETLPLREHPAHFMVAVGLAARGMADL